MNNQQDNKPKVLIVDDDANVNNLLRGVFESSGFEVKSAFDGLEGFDIATKFLPDVIVTGIVMPRMSGFEMIKSLKGNIATSKIAMIVFSHLGREEDRDKAANLGVRAFVVRGLIAPSDIVKKAASYLIRNKIYYLKFDAQDKDALELGRDFNFPPMFACNDNERMVLKLEPIDSDDASQAFKAIFICKKNGE